jgi:hypothetical protein
MPIYLTGSCSEDSSQGSAPLYGGSTTQLDPVRRQKFCTSAWESGCINRFIRAKFPLLYLLLLQLSNPILLFTGFHQEQVEVVVTTRDLLDDAHAARERNTAAPANLQKGAALVKMRKGNVADYQRQHFVRARRMRPSQRSSKALPPQQVSPPFNPHHPSAT